MKRSYRCADLVELERDSIKIQKICDYMDDLKFLKNSTIMSDEELVDLDEDDVAIEEGDDILNVYGDTSSEDLSDDLENDAELCPIIEEGKSFGPRRILRCSRRTPTRPSDDLFTSFDDFRSLLSDCPEKENKDNNNFLTNCY